MFKSSLFGQNNFAEHARLQRRIIKKDEELQSKGLPLYHMYILITYIELEKSHKTQLTKLNVVLRGTSTVLTVSAVTYCTN